MAEPRRQRRRRCGCGPRPRLLPALVQPQQVDVDFYLLGLDQGRQPPAAGPAPAPAAPLPRQFGHQSLN